MEMNELMGDDGVGATAAAMVVISSKLITNAQKHELYMMPRSW